MPDTAVQGAAERSAPLLINQPQLQESLGHLYFCRSQLGSAPPTPPSLRGKVGRLLVNLVRRMLFWFFPQVDSFYAASIEMAERQLAALETLAAAITRLEAVIERLPQESRPADPLSAPALRPGEDPRLGDIRRLRAELEQHQSKTEALLWLESVKLRAQVDELARKIRPPAPSASPERL